MDLKQRGLNKAPRPAVGDGALGFWKAVAKHRPRTDQQRCRVHKTTPPVESVFATVRLRTARTKNCGNQTTTLPMAFKLMETAQKKWFRLRDYRTT